MSLFRMLEVAEGLSQLDPVRTYPERGAELVSRIVSATTHRLSVDGGPLSGEDPGTEPDLSLPLRSGREQVGTLHLWLRPGDRLGDDELRLARWGARTLGRGICYARRLSAEGSRRQGEDISQTLKRAPLTPRERDVVSLLVSGASTRDIAARTGLTVSTVNTYLKRIFSKLGVHSRVELVARMAGTDVTPRQPTRGAEPTPPTTH